MMIHHREMPRDDYSEREKGARARDEGNLRARVDRLIGPLLKGRMPAGSRHT